MDHSNERKKFWRRIIKHRAIEALGGICVCCGQKFDDCCYDFHHIDPEQKETEFSKLNYNSAKSWLNIRDELKKCALVCANCHRKIHNNIIPNVEKTTFIDDYYNWDLTDYKQVSQNLLPIDANYICPICGGYKSAKAQTCINCSKIQQKKFEVDRERLKYLIRTQTFVNIGKEFGVSDNAIRKRCKTLNLPSKKRDINQYSDEEWASI